MAKFGTFWCPLVPTAVVYLGICFRISGHEHLQLSAMDVSAQASMKGAAKCDKHCELQNSEKQQISDRVWRCEVIPCSMSGSVSVSGCTILEVVCLPLLHLLARVQLFSAAYS